jgi:nitroreductase
MKMEVLEAIKTRRSIRKYTEGAMSEEQLGHILEAGRWAATKGNKQPWKFIILKDQTIRDELAAVLTTGKFLSQAPVGIAIAIKTDNSPEAPLDGAAATQNMLLAAHALGLGACWISAYDMPSENEAKRILNIPEGERLLSVISIGYPAEAPQKEKKDLDGITCTNKYE